MKDTKPMPTTHTPGPWTAYHRHITKQNWAKEHGQWIDHAIADCDEGPTEAEAVANARLIASAPALYAALQDLFKECVMVHKHWGDGSNSKQADAAIKAGEAALAAADGEGQP